ncbi:MULTISPECIES: YciI family protein [unclassified Aeromicrobium]|uniref:YciI family protein n=1 Tax=unclassified Aeromicrobium TaxID=2633570 RepID=UPI00396B1785
MAVFIVRFEHPNETGWKEWVRPHVEWVQQHVESGDIIASGPSVNTAVRQGWLVMRAEDEAALRTIISTDPFWPNGIVENLLIVQWDPIFGQLVAESSSPAGFDTTQLP